MREVLSNSWDMRPFIMRRNPILAVLPLLSICLVPSMAHTADYTFTAIVDNTSDLDPDFSSRGQRKINDSGEVTFLAQPEFASHVIYKGSGGALTQVAPAYWGLNIAGNGAIANSGEVTFRGGPAAFHVGIYSGSGGAPELVVSGDQTTDPGVKTLHFEVSVSNSGDIAWRQVTNVCDDMDCGPGTYGYYAIINGSGVTLAEQGGPWSDAGEWAPVINDTGQAAFTMVSAASGNYHLVRYDGSGLTPIDTNFIGSKGYWMNNTGDVVFAELGAISLYDSGVTTTVASTADGFDAFVKSGISEVFNNDAGDVAFWGSVSEFEGNPVNWEGVYRGPDIANDQVLVRGDTVMGHTIGSIELLGMNNAGQILLSVDSQSPDTWRALVVATPTAPPELPGDYNDDGAVNAADYVVWRKTGINGQQGYDTWREHFGESINGTGALGELTNSAVPEPTSLLIMFIAAGTIYLRRGAVA